MTTAPVRPGHGSRTATSTGRGRRLVSSRAGDLFGTALLAQLTGWTALVSWGGLVTSPSRYLVPALLLGSLIAVVGAGLRLLRWPTYAVAVTQLGMLAVFFHTRFAGDAALGSVLPTRASVAHLLDVLHTGSGALNDYVAPVAVQPHATAALLLLCSVGLLWSVDLLACGLGRIPLAGLPILFTLTVPISILADGVSWLVFVATSLLFLRLLGGEELARARHWRTHSEADHSPRSIEPLARRQWQIGTTVVALALFVPFLVPVAHLFDRPGGGGSGGPGPGDSVTVANPFIDMRRDLTARTHTPLVRARTDATDTGYLRLTVLDQFTGSQWRPAPRQVRNEDSANGKPLIIPGEGANLTGTKTSWRLSLDSQFSTQWLPLPYPVSAVKAPGEWRYDPTTLDFTYVGTGSVSGIDYSATGFVPQVDGTALDRAGRAPKEIRSLMTALPPDLPQVLRTRAEEVTRGATTDYAKAVKLQDWFRSGGGFRYSTQTRAGSGMALLARFVTDDRVGYCEQFATAMATMGRTLGIPSRVAIGFLSGEKAADGQIVYTSDDLHAWPEMFFAGTGWVRFEPTPAQRSGATPDYTRQDVHPIAPTQSGSATPSARPSTAIPNRVPETPTSSGTQGSTSNQAPLVIAIGLLLLLLGGVPYLARRQQRRTRLRSEVAPRELAEGAWAELQASAQDIGLGWAPGRSAREQAGALAGVVQATPDQLDQLEDLVGFVERGRYAATVPADPQTRAGVVHAVTTWAQLIHHNAGRWGALRARVLPRSVLRSAIRERRKASADARSRE